MTRPMVIFVVRPNDGYLRPIKCNYRLNLIGDISSPSCVHCNLYGIKSSTTRSGRMTIKSRIYRARSDISVCDISIALSGEIFFSVRASRCVTVVFLVGRLEYFLPSWDILIELLSASRSFTRVSPIVSHLCECRCQYQCRQRLSE